jgi:hypothetical protein
MKTGGKTARALLELYFHPQKGYSHGCCTASCIRLAGGMER